MIDQRTPILYDGGESSRINRGDFRVYGLVEYEDGAREWLTTFRGPHDDCVGVVRSYGMGLPAPVTVGLGDGKSGQVMARVLRASVEEMYSG